MHYVQLVMVLSLTNFMQEISYLTLGVSNREKTHAETIYPFWKYLLKVKNESTRTTSFCLTLTMKFWEATQELLEYYFTYLRLVSNSMIWRSLKYQGISSIQLIHHSDQQEKILKNFLKSIFIWCCFYLSDLLKWSTPERLYFMVLKLV